MEIGQTHKETLNSKVNGVCPYIGRSHDPEVCYAFPNSDNHCYKAKKPAPVDYQYQDQVCLTLKYSTCEVFQRGKAASLPGGIRLVERKGKIKRWLLTLLIGIIVPLIYTTFSLFNNYPPVSSTALLSQSPSTTASLDISAVKTELYSTEQAISTSKIPSFTLDMTMEETMKSIPLLENTQEPTQGPDMGTPFGPNRIYVLHEVMPGESFLLLANNYQTTTEVIQAINSRFEGAGLWIGEIIVVMPGQTDLVGLPKFQVIQLDQPRTLDQLAEEYGVLASDLQIYNSLGASLVNIPAGRWIIIPVDE